MDEAGFWQIIDRARGNGTEKPHGDRFARELEQLSNEQLVEFYVFYQTFLDRANVGDLWAAGVLLNGGHGSDDGFEYFRNWLIAQGSSVYGLAISAPDSLAAVDVEFQNGLPSAEWESFGRIPDEVFAKRTGTSLYGVAEPLLKRSKVAEGRQFDWSDYSDERMAVRLPKLWAKYGEIKMRHDKRVAAQVKGSESKMQPQEFEIPGLGTVKAGAVLYHKKFGAGTVLGIDRQGSEFIAKISFSESIRFVSLTALPDLFSREPIR